jgi:hypothetical protein
VQEPEFGCTKVWDFCAQPDSDEGIHVDFKLIYQGQLRATTARNTRIKEKHQIRQQLHKQLKELWRVHPTLTRRGNANVSEPEAPKGVYTKLVQATANKFSRCGYRFVPIVASELSLGCALDVILLRRDHPGSIIASGGDIDNRLKTLFDALRMPSKCDELPKGTPDSEEDPFFVLMEDDSQITRVSVTTERLLIPAGEGEHMHDVHILMSVNVNVIAATSWYGTNWAWLGP